MTFLLGLPALVLISVHTIAFSAANEFCHRGFQAAAKYHECWESATYANKYPQLYEPHKEYTQDFLQGYAVHMCSVVKPQALECFKKEVADCSNANKLVTIANESGGACEGDHLNPFFKSHIIDHLQTVPGDSPCFDIADSSYQCYVAAGQQIMDSGVDTVDISRFHKVADKFFNIIWDCLIDVFKSNSDKCKQWQLPMLLALQKTAMPSLFGMKLNRDQVAKLELEDASKLPTTKAPPVDTCKHDNDNVLLLLKILTDKSQAKKGDLLLQINSESGKPELVVAGDKVQDGKDVDNYIKQMLENEATSLSADQIKQMRKELKKKNKDIKNYINRIKQAQNKSKQDKKGKTAKPKIVDEDEMMINK
ncbi:uncharacterized protein LOC131935374 isoform X2 [Physella acuta]|uniref:uncharacterized protein LOC131935374 isoform X1 n=1 Tax=Physella acuta TaxID=109671 RepID=UPI0027DCFA33|nr:uncharacterized protein LOC131935374 isoform X1 [Physella acuta]XP_059147732.1 uncharacterized protein LOC131935374 isoform X2 [Physella acuta]